MSNRRRRFVAMRDSEFLEILDHIRSTQRTMRFLCFVSVVNLIIVFGALVLNLRDISA